MTNFYRDVSIVLSPEEIAHIDSLQPPDDLPIPRARLVRAWVAQAVTGSTPPPVANIGRRSPMRKQLLIRFDEDLCSKLKVFALANRCSLPNAIRRCLGLPAVMQGAPSSRIRVVIPDLLPPTAVPLVMRKVATVKLPKKGARR